MRERCVMSNFMRIVGLITESNHTIFSHPYNIIMIILWLKNPMDVLEIDLGGLLAKEFERQKLQVFLKIE